VSERGIEGERFSLSTKPFRETADIHEGSAKARYTAPRRTAVENQVSFEDIKELFRESDRKMAQSRAEYDRRAAETDRKMRETDRKMRETDRKLARIGEQIGGLGNRLGEFVEGVVRPGLVRLFRERGLDVHRALHDVGGDKNGVALQVDILVANDVDAVAVEVKSKLSSEDVDEHLERLGKFKTLFPEFASKRLLGAVAAMVIPDDAAAYAGKRGLFVIGQQGDDAVLLNAKGFEPRAW
jgi:hypothetical protein